MGNGIEKDRGIQSTLWKWAEESNLPTRPVAKGTDGTYDGRQVVEFVFSHFEKFSPKVKKQIEVLQKSFRALGFSDDEAKAILAGDPKTGAKRLVERGKDFEKRAAEAKAEKKPAAAHHLLEQAQTAYRLALGVDPKDAQAHRASADLLYRQGDAKAARESAGLAVRYADAKDIPGLIVWLHGLQDPAVKNSKGLDFVATNLIEARRFDDAKNLYEGAARAQSDAAVAQKFREKALLVEELGGAFKPTFDEKINPEVTKLHAALRAQGIPGGLMAGAPVEGKAARELNASQVLAFIDKNGGDPRVQKALKECGLALPKMKFRDAADQEAFAKLSYSQKHSLYHQRQAEAATNDKSKEKHLAASAHFDPTSTAKLRALAEFHFGQKDPSAAITEYRWLVKMDPANAVDRQALGKLYLSQDRWEEAYKVLPRAEAETMLAAKIDKARQFAEIKDFKQAEEIVRQVWGLLEGPYKGRAELPADEAAQILRLKAHLDLAAGAVHVLKEGPAQGVQGFQQALEASNEVLQKNPKDEQALLLRARANDKLGNGKAALADYLATSTLNQSPTLVPKDVKTSTSPTLRGIPMPEDYYRFVERYREQLRTDFKKELDTFKRFAHETSGDAKQQLQASREKLEAMAVDLRAFPEMSRNDQFEDLKLVREFFKYRNQWVEGQAVLKFEGQAVVDPKVPVVPANIVSLTEKWTDGNPTPDQVLEFAGAIKDKIFEAAVPGISTFQAKAKAQEEIAQRAREHKAFVNSWDYQELKVHVELELKAVEEQMREVRNELLPSLTLKPGEGASLEQVGNAEVASKINMELGHLNGLTNTLDQWKALVAALPADLLDTRYRLDQYGQILAGYRMVRAADEKTYNGPALPTDMEIHDRMLSILFGRQADGSYDKDRSFNDLAEKYVKSQGLPWDEKAFSDLTSAISSNETEAVRLLNFLSADGLKDFMTKNQQAGEIMKKAFAAGEDYAGAKAIAVEALRIYAQLGNSAKVEETFRYIESWGHYGPQNDNEIAREIQNLELYSAMADAVQGTNVRLTGESKEDADAQQKYADPGKVPRTYEELLLGEARSSAHRLTGRDFGDYIPGLVAARSFYEKDRDQENVREIDKKLKEEMDYRQDSLELRVQNMKSEVGKVGTSDSIVLLYSEGERQGAVSEASELMQARLALVGTIDMSKKESREAYGKRLLKDLEVFRTALESAPDLKPDFRFEMLKQLSSSAALYKKMFTEGESPAIKSEDLQAHIDAIAKLGEKIIDVHAFAFHPKLSTEDSWAIERVRAHGFPAHIESGIIGYYLDRSQEPQEIRGPHLTQADLDEIKKIENQYHYSYQLQQFSVEQYLIKAGKFRALTDEETNIHQGIRDDFKTLYKQAMNEGNFELLSNFTPGVLNQFSKASYEAHQKIEGAKNPEMPLHARLEASVEAAAIFGQLGLDARVEQALAPVKEHIDKQEPAVRASGYLSLGQIYENAGMEKEAKAQFQKVSDLDPGTGKSGNEKALHEAAVFARGRIQLVDGNLDKAKEILTEIKHNSLAAAELQKIDQVEYQKRVGFPLEFLSAVLLAEVDKRRGDTRDLEYISKREGKANEFHKEVQSFVSEAQRMLQSGEVKSLDEAIQKLRNAGGYYDVLGVLDRTGRGQDTLAYVKAVANPTLTDAQVSGETLRLAEKLLDREDFEFASHVSSLLTGDAYVGPQAKELVKTRIPDEAKWAARKAAIWKAVKDILIVPAIIEGRYGDAFVSALTTIASFGVGRIFSAGAKIAWAGFTARSVARAGWMARFAAYSPRAFRVAEVGAVAMADNAGFAVGGMMVETAKTGQNQFGWKRFWHEMLIGIAPFGLVHTSGKVMGAIGKRAEHIPWLKVATEAEVTLLKGQGKLAISQGGRAAVWTTHRLMNASAFTLGGMINQNLGFIEKDKSPLGLVFLQNLAMDFQMMAAHKGVNALTGGRMDKLDRKLDQELYLAPTLAKLKIAPNSPAGKAMSGFLLHYSDAMAGKRGKPLSGDELMKEVSALNESVMPLLKKNGLNQGDAFEAARAQIFIHAARKNLSAEHMKWYSERLKIPAEMDRMASDLLPADGFSKEVRDSMKSELLLWAMDRVGHPDNVQSYLNKFAELSGEMGKNLDRVVEGLMGPGSLDTPQGKRLREEILGRALGAAEVPSDAARLLEGMAKQAPSLGKAMGELVSGLDPRARIAAVEWATERGFDVDAFNHLRNEVKEGKVELKFEDGKLSAARVPEERQAEQKQKYETGLVEDRIRQRGEDAAKLASKLGLDGGFTKADRDRFGELVQKAAKESKISMSQAKELFQALDPALKRDVDPMHLDGVRRAIFLEVLGGKMGETRAWDLATKLAKGEILLEVGAFGEFTILQRPAAEKTADDDAKTQVRQPKADDDAKTQVRKPKSGDDTKADTVVELRKRKVSDNADTVVELRNRKAPVDTRKVGVADFKAINEVEAKADKIAKAAPSPERVQRYEKYLIEKKKMDPAEAKIQAEAWAKQVIVDARAYQAGRTHIYDTSLPLRPETAHMDAATVDHHGRFANAKNSTEQLIDKMEAVGALVKNDSKALEAAAKDAGAMAAARRGFKEAGIQSPSEKQVREVAAALREMNLKEVTTDNLADGGWSVWIAKNQARVLADPALRKLITEATHFEDFTAFGTTYDPKQPGIRLQAALFQKYGEILKDNGIVGSDRFTPAQADKVMREALAAIDQMVADPQARKSAADDFFAKVEEGKKVAAENGLMADASVHRGDTNLSFFDLTKMGDFTVFQQWLALPRVSPSGKDDTIQVLVVPMKPLEAVVNGKALKAERKLQIVAIPNGRELPSQKGLLTVLDAVNQAELAKAEALGLVPKEGEAPKDGQLPRDHFAKLWFGKDNVILPNPMKGGSLLSPKEVSVILTDQAPGSPQLGLFKKIEATPTGDNTVVQLKGGKGPKKPSGDADSDLKAAAHSGEAAPIPEKIAPEVTPSKGKPEEVTGVHTPRGKKGSGDVKAAAHSAGGGPRTEKLSPDSVPQHEPYWDPRIRMVDELLIGKIHEYYSSDGTRDDLASMAKRSDSWGGEAKKFQNDLAAFEKASQEFSQAERKFKSQTEADADPALYQKFRDLVQMAEKLENSAYHKLESAHTEMMKDLGRDLWPLENALAKMHFADLGANFERGKAEASFDFQMTFTSLDSLALYDGRWKGRRTEDLVKTEIRVESWDKAEEILSGLRQTKVKGLRDGKEATEYALELTGDIAKSPDGRKGRVAVTVKGPPSHSLEIHFELSAAQAKPDAAQQQLAAAGAGDRIVLRTVPTDPSFDGRSGHDLSGFRGSFAADYYETVQSSDSRRALPGGLLVPQAPNDPAPTVGTLWKVKAVQGDHVQLEDGRSFKDGKASPVTGPIILKMNGTSQFQAGDEVRMIPPVAGGSGDAKPRVLELTPPANSDSFIIGRDPNTSHFVLDGTEVSRNHATVARGQDGQWYLLDGTRDAQDQRKLSQNGVKAWDGQNEFPVGRENWYPLVDGQHIKIGEHWMVFRAPTAAKQSPDRTTSPDSASRDWNGFNANLQGAGISLNRLPEGQNRLDVYVGDPQRMSADAGPAIVASAFASGETPRYWGALWQGGDGWRYYPGENQTVLASDYSVKAPEADGGIRLAEGDVLSLGYHFYVYSKGELKLMADANQNGIPPHFDLHLPKKAAARSQVLGDMSERAPRGPLMDPQILSGSVDFSKSIPIHSTPATSENGEFSRVTTQGVAYKPVNEDVVFSARGPDGKLLMLNVDGMGGHADGDAAAILVAEAFKAEYQRSGDTAKAWELANQTVLRFNGASVHQKMPRDAAMAEARKIIADPSQFGLDPISKGSGAVAVMVEQSPPTSDGQAGKVRFEWVGDARAVLLRPDANKRLQWVYRTVDEGLPSMPGMLRPGVDFPVGGRGKTLVMQTHDDAHVVTNAIGTRGTLQVRGTQHGETPNPADPHGTSLVGDPYAKGLELQPNDWVILGSDGFWENFGRTELILNILDKATSADEATRLLTEEAHWRMDILGQAKAGTLPKAESGRYIFERPGGIYYIDGQGRWRKAQSMEIDRKGVVYELGGQTKVDHFKNDNFSLTVYRNNPDTASLKTDVQPPIDGRSGHDPGDGTGQGLYGGSNMEMKLIGSGDGSAKDLQELKQAYATKDAGLLKEIQSHGAVEGTARTYDAKEFPELLHLVMERGQPIEILPTTKKIRATVENEMYGFVVEVERRFPEEFKKAGKNDPDTGESFQIKGNDGKLKPNVPAMYRFAKRLLNGKLGLPVHGEASPRQKESVLGFMQGAMGRKDLDTYEKAAEALRQDFKAYGTEFQKAYKAAKPAMRDALLDAFFDGKRFATFSSLKEASGLLRFLGKTGHHVEFTLTADLSKQPAEYLLSIGDLTAAINPRPGLITIIHSHPTLYSNRQRRLMGHRDTLDLDTGKEVGHSASILFSPGDFDHMIFDAHRLTKDGVKMDGIHENGVYKNWVQHRFGLSEAEIKVGSDGKATEMNIRYGFYKGFSGLDGSHTAVIKQLQDYAKKTFPGVKVTFEEVPTAQIEGRIP